MGEFIGIVCLLIGAWALLRLCGGRLGLYVSFIAHPEYRALTVVRLKLAALRWVAHVVRRYEQWR